MSARPVCWRVSASRFSIDSRRVTSTVQKPARPPSSFERLHPRLARLFGQIGDDDVSARLGQARGQRPAQHARPADHHRGLAGKPEKFFKIVRMT